MKNAQAKEIVKKPYPSEYGSHSVMVDQAETDALKTSGKVALRDQFGIYVTDRSRLDNGLADPNRYAENRVRVKAEPKAE